MKFRKIIIFLVICTLTSAGEISDMLIDRFWKNTDTVFLKDNFPQICKKEKFINSLLENHIDHNLLSKYFPNTGRI